jgi:hypothetical protein
LEKIGILIDLYMDNSTDFLYFNRAECSLEKLRALNDYVKVHISTKSLSDCSEEYFQQFTVNTKFDLKRNLMRIFILVCCFN